MIKDQQEKRMRWRDVVAADLSAQFKAFINTILEPDLAARATLRSVKQSDYAKPFMKRTHPSTPQ